MVVIEGRQLREVEFVDGKPTTGPAPTFFEPKPQLEFDDADDAEIEDDDLRARPKKVPARSDNESARTTRPQTITPTAADKRTVRMPSLIFR